MRFTALIGLAAALAMSTATAATAAEAAKAGAKEQVSAEAGGTSTVAAPQERKICKTVETTGTRMKSNRVCLTKAEWQKVEAEM